MKIHSILVLFLSKDETNTAYFFISSKSKQTQNFVSWAKDWTKSGCHYQIKLGGQNEMFHRI